MKVTNWTRKLAAALAAAGIGLGASRALAQINHFIGDASFDDTDVNASTYTDYAYIGTGHVTAWEDGVTFGNWFYNTAYATVGSPKRPDPRTGTQALHGGGDYIWQDLGDTFEAGRRYTFSVYLGGDTDATGPTNGSDRAWLYIYDANARPDLSTTFFDGDSLIGGYFDRDGTNVINTGFGTATNAGWTIGGGNEWGLATMTYTAPPGIDGQPIGVAMFGRGDGAFDDVSLTSIVAPFEFGLRVNTTSGVASVVNDTDDPVEINYYEVRSPSGSLSVAGWNSFDDQNLDTMGGGPGQSWDEGGGSNSELLVEAFLLGTSQFGSGGGMNTIGNAYNVSANAQDLEFFYAGLDGGLKPGSIEYFAGNTGDFDGDGDFACADVDGLVAEIAAGTNSPAFDLTGDGLVNQLDLTAWLAEAGAAELPSGNPYLVGDATLDGVVDGLDFIAWNNNKFTPTAAWCAGDFSADGVVDGLDFILWNGNKFTSADHVSAVPEPTGWLWAFGMMLWPMASKSWRRAD